MSFSYYYVCEGNLGDGSTCGTVIASAAWCRRHDNPLQPQQRWYCGICGARYRVKWGTFCEWIIGTQSYVCLAVYPPPAVETMKEGLVLSGAHNPAWRTPATADALMKSIPMATPVSQAVVEVPGHPGHFKYNKQALANVPLMDWTAHFEMGRQAATGEWRPDPNTQQAPAMLRDSTLLAPEHRQAITTLAGGELPILDVTQAPAITESTGPFPITPEGQRAMDEARARMSREVANEVLAHMTYLGRAATEPELQAAWAMLKDELYSTAVVSPDRTRPMLTVEPLRDASAADSSGAIRI